MFNELENINTKPKPFEFYTANQLWTDEHISKKMLEFHLDKDVDVSSRNEKFIELSVNWITSYFDLDNNFSICDFGCGPGLYTSRFAEKGAKVTGIDFSRRSIEYAKNVAKQKCLEIDYVNQNYLSYETDKRFDLITMIMCDYCALSPEQREKLLKIFYKILKPGGSILLDAYTLESYKKREEHSLYETNLLNGFWSDEKYCGFLNIYKYEEEKVVLDKYTIIEKDRIRFIYNWLQYFSEESIKKEFDRNNFIIENIFSDVAGSNYNLNGDEIAIVAKKVL